LRLVCVSAQFHEADIPADFYRPEGGDHAAAFGHMGYPCMAGAVSWSKTLASLFARSAPLALRLQCATAKSPSQTIPAVPEIKAGRVHHWSRRRHLRARRLGTRGGIAGSHNFDHA